MEFTRYTLRNGIRCIHKQVRSAAVHCALTVGTGSRDEQPAEHGMAHLLEHAFFKGTERRRAYHINCRLENLGGELNAYTTKEETVIHTTTLRADLSKAAELIADIVFHSTFPAKELEKEKDIIVDEINSYKDSPSERIFDDFEDLVFKGSPLGHNILGSKASLMKYTRDDLKRFVARTYNTDQMVFSVIGNVSPKRFREICDRYFASQTASARTFSRERTAPYEPFSKTLHRNCHQAHCLLGGRAYSLRDDRRVALSLLSNLLGGPSANSLLNMAVRERNGLSYSIESSFTPLSDTGIATIYFGTDKDRTDECLSIVRHELERICRGELKERQLGIAKKQYIGQITLAMESNESYMLSAARSCLIYDSVDGLDELHAKIRSITATQIAEVAEEIFSEPGICRCCCTNDDERSGTIYRSAYRARGRASEGTRPRDAPERRTAAHALGTHAGPAARNARADARAQTHTRNRHVHRATRPFAWPGACLSAASCIRSKWTTSWKRSPRGISPAAASATGFSHISARRSIWLRRSAYST